MVPTRQRPRRATADHCQDPRNVDYAAELGVPTYVMWVGEGSEMDAAKDIRDALQRYKEGVDLLCQYVIDQGYDLCYRTQAQ